MKWLKSFDSIKESRFVDTILDKISKYGYDSITSDEKKYLKSLSDKPDHELEKKIKDRRIAKDHLFEYDPTEDEFFKEIGFEFNEYTKEEMEDGRYQILWNDVSDEDIMDFINWSKLDNLEKEDGFKPWDELTDHDKEKFKEWIDEIY